MFRLQSIIPRRFFAYVRIAPKPNKPAASIQPKILSQPSPVKSKFQKPTIMRKDPVVIFEAAPRKRIDTAIMLSTASCILYGVFALDLFMNGLPKAEDKKQTDHPAAISQGTRFVLIGSTLVGVLSVTILAFFNRSRNVLKLELMAADDFGASLLRISTKDFVQNKHVTTECSVQGIKRMKANTKLESFMFKVPNQFMPYYLSAKNNVKLDEEAMKAVFLK